MFDSDVESDACDIHHNGKQIIPICTTLLKMNHPQLGTTPIKTGDKILQGSLMKLFATISENHRM